MDGTLIHFKNINIYWLTSCYNHINLTSVYLYILDAIKEIIA